MTDDMIELGKRAVACKGWRWMPGMRTLNGRRFVVVFGESRTASVLCDLRDDANSDTEELQEELPDLTDPATLGCLLALVREAYDDSALYVRLSDTRRMSDGVRAWEVLGWLDPSRSPDGRGGSWRGWGYAAEAEALVAALESAP